MVVCYITWHTNTHIILLFYVWDYLYTYYAITFFDFFWPTHFRLVHVIWDFRQWDVMTKVRYHLMVPIYNLRTLEVEHDLETCQRPWSTWILTLWASQGPKNWKWSIKKQRTFFIISHGWKSQMTWTSLKFSKNW